MIEAADSYVKFDHFGFIIAGRFARGSHRGGGEVANAWDRDRVRALQLMVQSLPQLQTAGQPRATASFWWKMAEMLYSLRGEDQWWQLQRLTNLEVLPDYARGYHRPASTVGAPVDEQGNPIFYKEPKNWQGRGARTMASLAMPVAQVIENEPARTGEVRLFYADCLRNQFDVQTLAYFGTYFDSADHNEPTKENEGPWSLASLKEDETIARLATGIKRFPLPDEFNFIRIYQQIADDRGDRGGKSRQFAEDSLNRLAEIFENRRQYSRTAEYWRRSITESTGPGAKELQTSRLNQIVGNWGRFEPVMDADRPAKGPRSISDFEMETRVNVEAREIEIGKLLVDVKEYLKSNPRQLHRARLNIGDLGFRLVQQKHRNTLAGKSRHGN